MRLLVLIRCWGKGAFYDKRDIPDIPEDNILAGTNIICPKMKNIRSLHHKICLPYFSHDGHGAEKSVVSVGSEND